MTNFRKLQNEELNRISTEAFKKAPKLPVVILLDHVRSQNKCRFGLPNLRRFPHRKNLSLRYHLHSGKQGSA